jgi:hypothetical protein
MLGEERTGEFEHSELEARLDTQGRRLLRQLLQDHRGRGAAPPRPGHDLRQG